MKTNIRYNSITIKDILRLTPAICLCLLLFSSCVRTTQHYYINSDGSGKVRVKATMQMKGFITQKVDTGVTHEDKVKMVKKVREIIHQSTGIEAWDSIKYSLDKEKQLEFSGVAYFPDIQKLRLKTLPAIPVKTFNENKIRWTTRELASMKKPETHPGELNKKEIRKTLKKIRKEYRKASEIFSIALKMFEIKSIYHFPFKIRSVTNLVKKGKREVMAKFDGESILNGFERLMKNKQKLRMLIKEKGVRKFDFEDPRLVHAAYPDKALMKATFRTGWLSSGSRDPFDYEKETQNIETPLPAIPVPEKP